MGVRSCPESRCFASTMRISDRYRLPRTAHGSVQILSPRLAKALPTQGFRVLGASARLAAPRAPLQLPDPLRRLPLRQLAGWLLARLPREGLQVRPLRAGHRLLAGHPLIRVLGRVLVRCSIRHAAALPDPARRNRDVSGPPGLSWTLRQR